MKRKSKIIGTAALAWLALTPTLTPQKNAACAAEQSASEMFPNAQIEVKAQAALDAMRQAYADAKTIRTEVALRTRGFAGRPRFDLSAKMRRDAQISLKVVGEAVEESIVGDGTSMLNTNSLFRGRYVRGAAPSPVELVKVACNQVGVGDTILFRLLSKSNVLSVYGTSLKAVRLATDDDTKRAQEIAQQAGAPLGDLKDAQIVVAEYSRGGRSGTAFYVLGKSDHLLRAAVTERKNGAKTVSLVETHSDTKLNAPLADADFSTAPPEEWLPLKEFPTPPYDPRLKIGGAPFSIDATDLDGNKVSLDDYKGKVLLLDFWASWCPPCRTEAPEIAQFHENYHDNGFEILGVSLDESAPQARDFRQAANMTWRHVWQGSGWDSEYSRLYGVGSIPFTVLIGKDGKIAALGARGKVLSYRIEQALSGKRAPAPDTTPASSPMMR